MVGAHSQHKQGSHKAPGTQYQAHFGTATANRESNTPEPDPALADALAQELLPPHGPPKLPAAAAAAECQLPSMLQNNP
jgi:hypothetical protein